MKWLHISDLHYHPKEDGRATNELRDKMISFLKEKGVTVDQLFITGDFRHAKSGEDDEMVAENVVAFILEIANVIGITDKKHIHIVPGNHDLERLDDKESQQRFEDIHNDYDPNRGSFSGENMEFMLSRFSFFKLVVEKLYVTDSEWLSVPMPLHFGREFEDFNIIYMNSVATYNKDGDDKGRLSIGNEELYFILNEMKKRSTIKPIIVLAHNGINDFREHDREVFERFTMEYPIKLHLCGDAHEAWQRSISPSALEITIGAMKQESGSESAFISGDIEKHINDIKAYIWNGRHGSWNEYEAYNNRMMCYIAAVNPPGAQSRNRKEKNMEYKRDIFCQENLTRSDRFFLIKVNPDAESDDVELDKVADLIKAIAENYSKTSHRVDNKFCPYVKLFNFTYENLLEVKRLLYKDGLGFNDGYPFLDSGFILEEIHVEPNEYNKVKVKLLDERANFQEVINTSPNNKEIYQFYYKNPIISEVPDTIKNELIDIEDFDDIKEII